MDQGVWWKLTNYVFIVIPNTLYQHGNTACMIEPVYKLVAFIRSLGTVDMRSAR